MSAVSPSSTAKRLTTTGIPWMRLSPEGRAILATIGKQLSDGWTQREIATSLGRSTDWVSERVAELRRELERTAG